VPYVTFWREFKRRYPEVPLEMHKIHPPGERSEADYKGDAPGLGFVDKDGKFVQCKLFGSVLAFSQLFFSRATETEKQIDFLPALAKSYEYFGGVSHTTAVDNAKPQVVRAHRYDPDLNPEFAHFCEHYDTAPLAMRPGKPKDKNVIENALGVFWRWARRRVRARTFFSLGELNAFLLDLVDDFNNRVQRKYGISRRQKFENGEREKLLKLPTGTYTPGSWKKAKLHPDCHIQVGHNFYSAPYNLRGRELEVRITPQFIEVFHNLERVAMHMKASSNSMGRYLTKDSHLPPAHIALKEANVKSIIEDGDLVGSATGHVIRTLIEQACHPLMYLRRAQGILRLKKRYSEGVLDKACAVVVSIGIEFPKLKDIEDIVKNSKTLAAYENVVPIINRGKNENLRGQSSWKSQPTLEVHQHDK
jgi:hypothetical protein